MNGYNAGDPELISTEERIVRMAETIRELNQQLAAAEARAERLLHELTERNSEVQELESAYGLLRDIAEDAIKAARHAWKGMDHGQRVALTHWPWIGGDEYELSPLAQEAAIREGGEVMGLEELRRLDDERERAVWGKPSDATADAIRIHDLQVQLKNTQELLKAKIREHGGLLTDFEKLSQKFEAAKTIRELNQKLAAAEARAFQIATESQAFHEESEMYKRHTDDLVILVRRLCYQIKEENNVKRLSLDYLQRTGCEASVLRDGEFAAIRAEKEGT